MLVLLLCSGCVDFTPLNIEGILESENPKIRIVISDDPGFGHDGELIQDDNAVVKILFTGRQGKFFIYKYQEDKAYGTNSTILFRGSYKIKDDTLILKTEDGSKIILKKNDE